jgi:hypothetical protein
MLLLLLLLVLGVIPLPPGPLADIIPVARAADETTVWWRNSEGSVIERRSGENVDCRLHLGNEGSNVTFCQPQGQPSHLTVTHQGWNFTPDAFSLSAVQVGQVWLGGGSEADSRIMTLLHGDSAIMMLTDPISALLRSTDQITVKLNSETLSIPLTRSKVAALAVGLRKCLETIDR